MPRFETNVIRVENYIYKVSLGGNGNENICRFLKKMKQTNENEWGCNICLEDKLEHELETIYVPVKPTAKPLLKYKEEKHPIQNHISQS